VPRTRFSEPGQHPIAEPLVDGHATPLGRALLHHPRTEHRRAVAALERLDHLGQALRCVLAVAVQEHDHVEPVLDRQRVGRLLVAAVAKILRMTDDMRCRTVRAGRPLTAEIEGVIVAGVVAHDHLGDPAPEVVRDAVERREQGRGGVVGDHDDADAWV